MILAGIVSVDVYGKTPDWLAKRRAGQVKFADSDFTAALAKFANLAQQGYIAKSDVSQDYAATQQAFLDGKGAMYPMGNWFATEVDGNKAAFDVGQFNWPSDDGKMVVPAFTGGGLLVNAKAKNLDAARKFALAFQL